MRRREDSGNGRVLVWPIAAHSRDGEKHENSQVKLVGNVLLWGRTAVLPKHPGPGGESVHQQGRSLPSTTISYFRNRIRQVTNMMTGLSRLVRGSVVVRVKIRTQKSGPPLPRSPARPGAGTQMQGHQTRQHGTWRRISRALTSSQSARRIGGHDSNMLVGGGPIIMLTWFIVECNLVYPCGRFGKALVDPATAIKRARTRSSQFIK